MKQFARTMVLSVSAAAVVLSAMPMAEAGHRDRHHHAERRHDRVGEAIGAGIIGLAVGAIVIGIFSEQQTDRDFGDNPYRRPRPSPDRPGFPAAPSNYPDEDYYVGSLEPWSPGWYRYCSARYRSFIPSEGTFTTYSGEKRFCVAE